MGWLVGGRVCLPEERKKPELPPPRPRLPPREETGLGRRGGGERPRGKTRGSGEKWDGEGQGVGEEGPSRFSANLSTFIREMGLQSPAPRQVRSIPKKGRGAEEVQPEGAQRQRGTRGAQGRGGRDTLEETELGAARRRGSGNGLFWSSLGVSAAAGPRGSQPARGGAPRSPPCCSPPVGGKRPSCSGGRLWGAAP